MHLTKTFSWLSEVWLPKFAKISGYTLGAFGGRSRIVLGAYPFIKNDAPDDVINEILEHFGSANIDELNDSALAHTDPLGYSLSDHCILLADWQKTKNLLAKGDNVLNVLNSIVYNIVFLDLIQETLLNQALTCLVNKTIDEAPINGRSQIKRNSVVARLLHQRYHLSADGYASLSDYAKLSMSSDPAVVRFSVPLDCNGSKVQRNASLRMAALSRCIILGKTPHTVIKPTWWDPYVAERGASNPTYGGALKNLGKAPRSIRYNSMLELLSYVDESIFDNGDTQEESRDTREAMSAERSAEISIRRNKQYRAVHGGIISRVSKANRPGLDVMMGFWSDAIKEAPNDLGAAVVAGMISGALDPMHWRDVQVVSGGMSSLIGTPVRHPINETSVDQTLHIPTCTIFWRFVPESMATVIQLHKAASVEAMLGAANNWLKCRNDRMTLPRLRDALCWSFPLEVDIQSIYWRLGLVSDPKSLGGDRSYINWHPLNTLDTMMHFYRLLDPHFEAFEHEVRSCGSAFTPALDVLKSLFGKQQEFINNIPQVDMSVELIVERANFISACGRFTEALLSFTRNRDAFLPLEILCNAGTYFCTERIRIVHEKEWPRIVCFSEVLRQHESIVRKALDCYLNLLRLKGLFPSHPEEIRIGLYFLEIRDSLVSVHPPTRLRMLNALEACDETSEFIGLHPHAARHAGNTYLRNIGFHEPAILALMDHFAARIRSPLSPHSMRIPVPMKLAQAAGLSLANYFGIIH